MLVGVYIKNFKCYQGTEFVPVFSDEPNKFVGLLGDNGVGKSAVLEALNVFFSNRPQWLRNKDAKTGADKCFVAPVFIVDKRKTKQDLSKLPKTLYFDLKDTGFDEEVMFVACVARREDGIFTLFDGKKEFSTDEDQGLAHDLYKELTKLYQYIYIQSEVDIDEEAKINSNIYEMIVESSIVNEVEKKFKESDEKNTLINNLNETLGNLIDEKLVSKLQQIDKGYTYTGTKGALSRLSTGVLARVSTEAFLNSRRLKYKSKQLEDLSSGQRRTALLDFITAVLENKVFDESKTLIFAIDEPEISLDTGKKMGQFEKLSHIAKSRTAVIFTSHWYGWIASAGIGRSILIEDSEFGKNITKFENIEFPFKEIPKYEMRMIFDFLMSLGANAEANEDKKYIICEGFSDVILLSASLGDDSCKIIPVGKGQVKKISDIFKNYYWKSNGPTVKNVLFLIDTDPEHKDEYNNVYLHRWAKDNDFNFKLVSNGDNFQNKCTIENILEPNILLCALQATYVGEPLIQSLSVKHPDVSGTDEYGMSQVDLRKFEIITRKGKIEIANRYSEFLLSSPEKNNLLKTLVLKAFTG
jgi:ABC-type cobalamin/Fe3+-siderophores transport system ATPase subunit